MRLPRASVSGCVLLPSLAPAPKDFSVEPKGSRLIVTRLATLRSPLQVGQVQFALGRALEKIKFKAVICSDWRPIDIFAPAVADAVLGMLTMTNHKVLRGGILLNSDRATFNLQVERVLRDAANGNRKCFCDKSKLLEWISEPLEPPEILEAQQFLEEI